MGTEACVYVCEQVYGACNFGHKHTCTHIQTHMKGAGQPLMSTLHTPR